MTPITFSMIAKLDGVCAICGRAVIAGEHEIAKCDLGWAHIGCAEARISGEAET